MRIPRLRGVNGTLLKCPACRLKCLKAAVGPDGACPRCGHADLMKIDTLRGGRPASQRLPEEHGGERR